jgi:hypothetical protein
MISVLQFDCCLGWNPCHLVNMEPLHLSCSWQSRQHGAASAPCDVFDVHQNKFGLQALCNLHMQASRSANIALLQCNRMLLLCWLLCWLLC